MIRALSTRKDRSGYKKLDEDKEAAGAGLFEGEQQSVPVGLNKPVEKGSGSIHPLLSFFDIRRKKKTKKKSTTTAKPEFARYMEYVKEEGVWDASTNSPVIYYR